MKTLLLSFLFVFAFVALKANNANTGTQAVAKSPSQLEVAGAAADAAILAPAHAEATPAATTAFEKENSATVKTVAANVSGAKKLGFFGRMRETAKLYKALKHEMKVMKADRTTKADKTDARLTKTNVILLAALGLLALILGIILGGGFGIVLATLGVALLVVLLILYLI